MSSCKVLLYLYSISRQRKFIQMTFVDSFVFGEPAKKHNVHPQSAKCRALPNSRVVHLNQKAWIRIAASSSLFIGLWEDSSLLQTGFIIHFFRKGYSNPICSFRFRKISRSIIINASKLPAKKRSKPVGTKTYFTVCKVGGFREWTAICGGGCVSSAGGVLGETPNVA